MSEFASRGVMGSRRLNRARWWSLGLTALVVSLLAVAASAASQEARAVDGSCSGPFTIDFAGLPAGTIIGEQYAQFGVHISGVANEGFPDSLIIFDTNAPPTHDPDLAVDIGNIAIFAKNVTDQNGDGLVDDPDENNFGGTATFKFDQPVTIGSLLWVDKDHANPNFVVAYDGAGGILANVPVPQGANASVQSVEVNADGVRRLDLVYHESGGFTGIEVTCQQATPTPTAPATPTAAAASATPAPIVAADPVVPQTPAALAVASLPSTGGPPDAGGDIGWALAPLAITLVASGSLVIWAARNVKR
jgi:hypothetical protein